MQGTHYRPLRGYVDIFPANAPSLAVIGVYSKRVPCLLTVRKMADTSREYQMYSRMEQFVMFMNIYKSCLFCSCNDSLRRVTVYCATLEHQSASTKVRSEKERETRKQQQDRSAWGLIINKRLESTTSEDTHR